MVRDEVSQLDANLPVYRFRTMAQVVRDALWNGRVSSNLFLMLTFIAVALSTIGLYAVTAHGVAQRAQEIGLRMALGAQPRHVTRLIARRVAMQLVIGFMAGIVCTKLWDANFGSGSDGVTASDPKSLLIVAGILACWPRWPAWFPRVGRHAWIRLPRYVRNDPGGPPKNRAASTPNVGRWSLGVESCSDSSSRVRTPYVRGRTGVQRTSRQLDRDSNAKSPRKSRPAVAPVVLFHLRSFLE